MNIKENIRIAIFSIRTNLMRSLLTMLGIIIGVSSVIAIITVGNGGRDYIVGMIKEMGSSNAVSIMVNPNLASSSDYITGDDIAAIKDLEIVDHISPAVIGMGAFSTSHTDGFAFTIGGSVDLKYIMGSDCAYGRFFTQQEYDSARNVAIIDTASALLIFGYENVVGEKITYTVNDNSYTLKIIGVMDLLSMFGSSTSDFSDQMSSLTSMMGGGVAMNTCMLLIPASVASSTLGAQERYDTCYIMSEDPSDLDAAGNAAISLLKARHKNFDRENVYQATNLASLVDLLDTVISVFTLFIACVSGISLVVGGIGVMNIMLVTVTERTREIGIRKALGARTSVILMQFLTESVILCLIGGVIGLALGVGSALTAAHIVGVPIEVKASTILIAVGFSSAIGIFFGIYPARRAAKMPPIEALRSQ